MSEISNLIDKTEERFKKVAPAAMQFDAEKGFAIQLLNNNPLLFESAKANPVFFQQALASVAAIGLSLNPAKKEAYLITRNVKVKLPNGKDTYQSRVYLEPSYMGLCNIATSSGRIEWVQAQIVREDDSFEYVGVGEKPVHRFNAFKDRGDIIGVYAIAKTNNGDFLTDLMDIEQINSIKDRSESIKAAKRKNQNEYGPWVTDFEEMAKKSAVRRLFKMLPKTGLERMEQAVSISNENEGFEPLNTAPDIGITGEKKSYFDSLIEKSNSLGMYAFSRSCLESEFQSLYHSFEKGTKGKYQGIVDALVKSGREIAVDYCTLINDALMADDDLKVQETIGELTDEEYLAVLSMMEPEQQSEIEKIKAANQ